MKRMIALSSALAMAIAMPALAQGNGKGNGGGNGKGGGAAKMERGGGGGGPKADRGNRGGPAMAQERGGPQRADMPGGPGRGSAEKAERRAERKVEQRVERRVDRRDDRRDDRREGRFEDRLARGIERNVERRVDRFDFRDRDEARSFARVFDRDVRPVTGWCPPGLAKKGNGCLPPGQAKKLYGDRFGGYYRTAYPRFGGGDWRYYNGYAYRPGGNLIDNLVPLVGGALFAGNVWPTAYNAYAVPDYYRSFYGYNTDYRYYYADRTIFSVNPEDQAIMGIAALLTGNDIQVGQRLPTSYPVYNVPYNYRTRYVDGPDAIYRYSDGYVYKVDPETMLVASAIDLIV